MAAEAARDLGLRVLRQEPPPARLRQPAQGPAHHRQGGGRQLARRLRGGRHPARADDRGPRPRLEAAGRADEGRGPLPRHRRGQRPRHRQGAGPEDLRQAPLRLEVPPPQDEPRPAGHRHLAPPACTARSPPASRSVSRAASAGRRPPTSSRSSIDTREERAGDRPTTRCSPSGTRSTAPASSSRSWPTGSRASASSTATSSTPPSPTRTRIRYSRPVARPSARRRPARQRDAHLPARRDELPQGVARDQAAPARRRARHADADGARVEEPRRPGLPAVDLQPRLARRRRGDPREGRLGQEAPCGRACSARTARWPRSCTRRSPRRS